MTLSTFLFAAMAGWALWGSAGAQEFKFSEAEKVNQAQKLEAHARNQALLNAPCKAKIKNQKIMVLIGLDQNGTLLTTQSGFSAHFDAVNRRLQAVGLKTVTEEQIRSQIKQAEIDAYFKNDADAALSASRRLAAQFVLRGLISTSAHYNRMVQVNQVQVNMAFTLTGANGRVVSQATAQSASYAGQDPTAMALTLVNEQAEDVVAQLYSDYCGQTTPR